MKQHWKDLSPTQIQINWNEYVRGTGTYQGKGLLKRLYGLELMFTPHFIAHLQLGMILADEELPFYFSAHDSLSILKANALEKQPLLDDLFFPIVVGNPPYSGESKNRSTWIMQSYQK